MKFPVFKNIKLLTDYLFSRFLKTGIFLIFSILTTVCLCQTSAAQWEEDMQYLQMYYKPEELVISPTRHAKPVSQVAENIYIITAKEIKDMNAHTVAEILNRTPGLFVAFSQDFGADSSISIQGSEDRHVLVSIDGISWNFLGSGVAETNSIPVGIIERIEVIKGPASSAWGSSLGGVVNIITKPVGNTKKPTGTISASCGERNTQDYRVGVSGKAGPAGYYLFAGYQDSEGFGPGRDFDNYSLYSKFRVPLTEGVDIDLSMGYSEPHSGYGDFVSHGITSDGANHNFFATASLDARLTRELCLKLSFRSFKQKLVNDIKVLETGFMGASGERVQKVTYDEKTTGGSGHLVWAHQRHTAVLGFDASTGRLRQKMEAGPFLQSNGILPVSKARPDIDKWAIYANDTIVIDKWSITPGVRYDHNSITSSFTSPSLGITYQPAKGSILRASVARGFTIPPLSTTSAGGFLLDPNPSLDPEEVWSYQLGFESSAIKYLWVKVTLFRHDLKDALTRVLYAGGPPAYNDLIVNKGKRRRRGIEIETETDPFYNFSLLAGFSFVDLTPANKEKGSEEMYSYNIGVRYDDKKSLSARLFGHYAWWNLLKDFEANYNDFIWDLNINKKICCKKNTGAEIFFAVHNIFDGLHSTQPDDKNPGRWIEAGVRFSF